MCGIAGFVGVEAAVSAEKTLQRMTGAIRHRGPDDEGFYHDQWAHLGHRRLSIVDVVGGHQPLFNEDSSRLIIYNGELFNHAGLRPALEAAGHKYKTRSDTETILHSYEERGPDCVKDFRGMFAFVIWDKNTRTLFGARDRLGIKPFYYYWDGRTFAFASEIKALFEHPAISAQLEEEVLPEYLGFGYVSEARTLFRNIRKLMPGHHVRLSLQGAAPKLEIQRYWDVPETAAAGPMDESEWIAETRRRLEETVQMRLMADVPLGMFLSGGIDSSAIAALISRRKDGRMTGGPLKTFSVGYEEAKFSELGYAAQVAKAIGTEHHEVRVGMGDFFNALPKLIWHEDEPIAWPSSVSLYFVSKLAAKQVKVVLTGEGSDELFGGYERYRWNLWNRKWAGRWGVVPSFVRANVRNGIASSGLLRASLRRKLRHTFLGRENTIEELYLDNFYCAFSMEEQKRLLAAPSAAVYGNYLRYFNGRAGDSDLRRMLYADQKTYLVELLMKQDQMSMAASLESRVPFLDHEFVSFAMSIPDHLKIRGREQKWILKKAVEDILPREIVYRKKMGFPTPLRQWLLDPKAAPLFETLADKNGFVASLLDLPALRALLDRHRSGAEDATDRVWSLLNLQVWGDLYFTGKRDRWQEGFFEQEPAPSAA